MTIRSFLFALIVIWASFNAASCFAVPILFQLSLHQENAMQAQVTPAETSANEDAEPFDYSALPTLLNEAKGIFQNLHTLSGLIACLDEQESKPARSAWPTGKRITTQFNNQPIQERYTPNISLKAILEETIKENEALKSLALSGIEHYRSFRIQGLSHQLKLVNALTGITESSIKPSRNLLDSTPLIPAAHQAQSSQDTGSSTAYLSSLINFFWSWKGLALSFCLLMLLSRIFR